MQSRVSTNFIILDHILLNQYSIISALLGSFHNIKSRTNIKVEPDRPNKSCVEMKEG